MSKKAEQSGSGPGSGPESEDDAELADVDFESALGELEALVEQMETGELSLEDSLKAFERGVKLTRHCQGALKNAELKVKVLTESNRLEDLDLDDLDDT
jgi:exodeoxyribonuclease VII small subunit